MEINGVSQGELARYTAAQIERMFPAEAPHFASIMEAHMGGALERLHACIGSVRMWKPDTFDIFHSSQYCSYLYLLSHTIWKSTGDRELPTRLFLLNKALNAIDLFYEIDLPEHFLIGHSVGIVLAKATYGDFLVLYQNSTVGKNHGRAPVLGRGTILYPNSAVIGGCELGANTTLGQGASLIDRSTPGDCIVFRGADGGAAIKAAGRRYIDDYFRL